MKLEDLLLVDNEGRQYKLVKVGSSTPEPAMHPSPFGVWLKKERIQLDITQKRVAEITGVLQPNIAAIELGLRSPRPCTQEKIRAGLVEWAASR